MSMMPATVQIKGAAKKCTDLLTSGLNRVMAFFFGVSIGTGSPLLDVMGYDCSVFSVCSSTEPPALCQGEMSRAVFLFLRKNRGSDRRPTEIFHPAAIFLPDGIPGNEQGSSVCIISTYRAIYAFIMRLP